MNQKCFDISKFDKMDKLLLETINNNSSLFNFIEVNKLSYSQVYKRIEKYIELDCLIIQDKEYRMTNLGFSVYKRLNEIFHSDYKNVRLKLRDDMKIKRMGLYDIYIKK